MARAPVARRRSTFTGSDGAPTITRFFTGDFPGWVLRVLMIAMAVAFTVPVLVAHELFPGYTFFDYTVSALGNPVLNPDGWFFFSIAMWGLAVLNVPFFMHACRVFARYTPVVAMVLRITSWFIVAGLVLLGIFPESAGTAGGHLAGAGFVFLGFFVFAVVSWWTLGKMALAATTRARRVGITVATVAMAVILLGVSGPTVIAFATYTEHATTTSLLANLMFWEWMYLAALGAYLFLLELVVSRDPRAVPGARS